MQLTLPVQLPVDQQFDGYISGANEQLVERLRTLVDSLRQGVCDQQLLNQIYIHAPNGQGKSHLLFAACHYCETAGIEHFYLNLSQARQMPVGMLDGLAETTLICIDDLNAIEGHKEWQIAIFDLINQRSENQAGALILTSTTPPADEYFKNSDHWLPDLVSRLSWGETYAIQPLNQPQQIKLLNHMAEHKGLKFTEQAFTFILNHCERSTGTLVDIIERLDRRSLVEKKPLSVNMVKRELNL